MINELTIQVLHSTLSIHHSRCLFTIVPPAYFPKPMHPVGSREENKERRKKRNEERRVSQD